MKCVSLKLDVPPKSNANYGWILNMVSKLSENGVAGFILANGALSGTGDEYKIRKKLIENDLVEAIIIIPRNTSCIRIFIGGLFLKPLSIITLEPLGFFTTTFI